VKPVVQVKDLEVRFGDADPVIAGVSYSVSKGETLALVGESGSGKTLSCKAILRILPAAARITAGSIQLHADEQDFEMTALGEKALREIRGNHIAMMFQEPMSAFSPLHTIGNQVCEVLSVHGKGDGKAEAMDVFARVGFVEPQRAFDAYPFELSGGMRQRAMIAMAMVAKPDLIIADEPTTALDVTTQAQVLGLMKDLQAESGTAIIIVTHDLGVVANVADTVAVMRKGRVMEAGGMRPVLSAPQHGYTQKLVAAAPLVSDVYCSHGRALGTKGADQGG